MLSVSELNFLNFIYEKSGGYLAFCDEPPHGGICVNFDSVFYTPAFLYESESGFAVKREYEYILHLLKDKNASPTRKINFLISTIKEMVENENQVKDIIYLINNFGTNNLT